MRNATCRFLVLAVLISAQWLPAPAEAQFVPSRKADIGLWLKADAIDTNDSTQVRLVANSAYVTNWFDSSPFSNACTQTTDVNQPVYTNNIAAINNKAAVHFDGTDDRMYGTKNHRDGMTVIYVARMLDGIPWAYTTSPVRYFGIVGGSHYRYRGIGPNYSPPATGAYHIFAASIDTPLNGATASIWVDDVFKVSGTTDVADDTGTDLLGDRVGFSAHFSGELAELFVYGVTLTTRELNRTGAYLEEKYGLTTAYSYWPDMAVLGIGSTISDGDNAPTAGDGTDFGVTSISGGQVDHVFTITNSGDTVLMLTNATPVAVTGDSAFTVLTSPGATNINPGGSTQFALRFAPTTTGPKNAAVSIADTDPEKDPYNFAVTGYGIVPGSPDMLVAGRGVPIADGDVSPSLADNTDFRWRMAGESAETTFTIFNQGDTALTLTGTPLVNIAGPHAGDFIVSRQPTNTVAAFSNTTFTLRFAPAEIGALTATVIIANSDTGHNPYDFSMAGIGDPAFVPPQATNLGLWLRADNVRDALSGESVSNWLDSSTFSNHCQQATPDYRPTWTQTVAALNGRSAVAFIGNDSMTGTRNHVDGMTVIYLARINSGVPWSNTAPNLRYFGEVSGQQYRYRNGAGPNFAAMTGAYHIFAAVIDGLGSGATARLYADGLQKASAAVGDATATGTDIVGSRLSDQYLNGAIAELFVYDVTLSSNEVNDVGVYLEEKYGLVTAYQRAIPAGTMLLVR